MTPRGPVRKPKPRWQGGGTPSGGLGAGTASRVRKPTPAWPLRLRVQRRPLAAAAPRTAGSCPEMRLSLDGSSPGRQGNAPLIIPFTETQTTACGCLLSEKIPPRATSVPTRHSVASPSGAAKKRLSFLAQAFCIQSE